MKHVILLNISPRRDHADTVVIAEIKTNSRVVHCRGDNYYFQHNQTSEGDANADIYVAGWVTNTDDEPVVGEELFMQESSSWGSLHGARIPSSHAYDENWFVKSAYEFSQT